MAYGSNGGGSRKPASSKPIAVTGQKKRSKGAPALQEKTTSEIGYASVRTGYEVMGHPTNKKAGGSD